MKLIKLQIENFKCIEDSQEFGIDQVTCLMGKNEAGKTAILEALYKLNPVEQDKADFEELEYPRRHIANYRELSQETPANVITSEWELEPEDLKFIDNHLGKKIIKGTKIKLKRGYDNISRWEVDVDEDHYIKDFLASFKLNAPELAQIQKAGSVKNLIEKLETLETLTEKQEDILQKLSEKFPNKSFQTFVYNLLAKRLPLFLYFDTYHKLPGRIALSDLKRREDEGNLNFGDKIFLALLDMTSSGLEEIEDIGQSEKLIMELEAIENSLTDQIFEYWSQNKHLDVNFRFDHSQPQDPPPYNAGYIFNTRIHNTRHRMTLNFDERSSGFIWFFSFLIWFSQVKKNYGNNLFILLDEPGLSLHGTAQKDLLRYINEKLRPYHQVIYSTHSPFMIDVENIFSLRTVEDTVEKVKEGDDITEKVLGTKVSQRILSRDRDSIFPLQGIVGYDIAQTMFVGPYVLVVEGPTESALFNWFSRELVKRSREGLDIRWTVCPAESASKISSFVTLFHGRGLKIATMMDYHEGQKNMVDKLEKKGLLEKGHLLKTTTYAEQEDADIEDIVGREMYIHLVNKALVLPDSLKIPDQKQETAEQRVVKEVSNHCSLLPPGFPEFEHYMPAEYLQQLSEQEIENIPGLDDALGRFEKIFHYLNALI